MQAYDPKQPISRAAVLSVVTLASFMTPFMGASINIALPAIQATFGLDAVRLGWIQTAYLLAAAVCMVPMGKLADIHGRKKTFAAGMAVFTAGTLFAGLAASSSMLVAARIGQGLGSAMTFASGLAILTSVFPPGERGRAIGINVAAVYTGLSMGPVLGGLLTQHLGWRSIFLTNVPLTLAAFLLVLAKLKTEWADARGEKFDLPGSLFYSVSLTSLIYGLTLLPDQVSILLICAGLAGLLGFVVWESKTPSPVFEIMLFRTNRVFAFSNLAALINYSATFGVTFLLSLYLQYIKGLSAQSAGFILVTQPAVMAVFSPVAGRLSDRVSPGLVASCGMGLTALGLLAFTFLGRGTSLAFIVGTLFFIGLGFALFSSPNTNAIMSSVEKRHLGLASGAVSTMRLLGQMVSMGIVTLIFAMVIGRVEITPDRHEQFLKSAGIAFLVFTLLCGLGVLASAQRVRPPLGGKTDAG